MVRHYICKDQWFSLNSIIWENQRYLISSSALHLTTQSWACKFSRWKDSNACTFFFLIQNALFGTNYTLTGCHWWLGRWGCRDKRSMRRHKYADLLLSCVVLILQLWSCWLINFFFITNIQYDYLEQVYSPFISISHRCRRFLREMSQEIKEIGPGKLTPISYPIFLLMYGAK